MPAARNIDALTGLRGLAAWWVVFYHFREALSPHNPLVKLFAAGYLAVDLFFVLSGFVLMLSYGNAFHAKLKTSVIKKFYIRRFVRIYPLHLAVLLLFLINPLMLSLFSEQKSYDDRYTLSYFVLSVLLIQNWGVTHSLQWNIPAWSISVEWFASLVFPLLAFIYHKFNDWRHCSCVVFAFASCAAIVCVFDGLGYGSIGADIPATGIARCFFELMLGMSAAVIFKNNQFAFITPWGSVLASSIIGFACAGAGLNDYYYIPLISFILVLGLSREDRYLKGILANRFLVHVGEISFSTYIVHYLCKDWVKFFFSSITFWSFWLYIVLTIVASYVIYHLVEVPSKTYSGRIFYK